jgi:hypothetical protein
MIKQMIGRRLTRRERIIAQVCCIQILDSMKNRKEDLTDIEREILPELEEIIKKLETK